MKLIARMPGVILQCTCETSPGHPCAVHRKRAFIEYRITAPRWWWRFWFGVLKR